MGIVRKVALVFTAVCLIAAAVSMLGPTTMSFCAGSECSTVECGSAAFPKALVDFESPDDAANCAGQTSASFAFYLVLLAGLGLGVVAVTAWRSSKGDADAVGVDTDHDRAGA